jgi:hypothetical protein
MSTRSTLIIKDEQGDIILQLFRHWDGYFSVAGRDIVEFIQGGKLVNGFNQDSEYGKVYNGMGDLACQLIAHFKRPMPLYNDKTTLVQSVGGFYVEKIDPSTYESYQYELGCKNGELYLLGRGHDRNPNEWHKLFPLTPKSHKLLEMKPLKKSKKTP